MNKEAKQYLILFGLFILFVLGMKYGLRTTIIDKINKPEEVKSLIDLDKSKDKDIK